MNIDIPDINRKRIDIFFKYFRRYIKGQTTKKDGTYVSFNWSLNSTGWEESRQHICFWIHTDNYKINGEYDLNIDDFKDLGDEIKSLGILDKDYIVKINNDLTITKRISIITSLAYDNSRYETKVNKDNRMFQVDINPYFEYKYFSDIYVDTLLNILGFDYKDMKYKSNQELDEIAKKMNNICMDVAYKFLDLVKPDIDRIKDKLSTMNLEDKLHQYENKELFESKEQLGESMNQYVYTQGYTIRDKNANWYGEHNMLRVKRDGTTDFIKYYSKAAGTPWGRFLNKRDAEYFMIKKNLPENRYEVVKAKHPKYLKLVDENYGLYKVIRDDDYDLIVSGKDKVKYIDNSGTQQDAPIIPDTVKKSNSKIAWYILKEPINKYWSKYIENTKPNFNNIDKNNKIKYSMDIMERTAYFSGSNTPNKLSIYMKNSLESPDFDLSPYINLILDLASDENYITKGFRTVSSGWNNGLDWYTTVEIPFKDILEHSAVNLQYDKLNQLSDKQIFDIKNDILEREKSIYQEVILPKLSTSLDDLKEYVKKAVSELDKYFDTEMFESLDMKQLFDEVYKN